MRLHYYEPVFYQAYPSIVPSTTSPVTVSLPTIARPIPVPPDSTATVTKFATDFKQIFWTFDIIGTPESENWWAHKFSLSNVSLACFRNSSTFLMYYYFYFKYFLSHSSSHELLFPYRIVIDCANNNTSDTNLATVTPWRHPRVDHVLFAPFLPVFSTLHTITGILNVFSDNIIKVFQYFAYIMNSINFLILFILPF